MAEMTYQSLEEVGSDYISAAQDETSALFRQGEVVLNAIDQGFPVKQVVYHCASLTRRKARTVFRRYAVARTFPPETRNTELDWEFHALCAATDNPYKWLEIASEGYTDERGEHHGHTTRTLKAAIKAAGGDPDKGKPQMLLDGVECTLQRIVRLPLTETHEAVFNLTDEQAQSLSDVPYGVVLQLTLMYAPAPELENVA